MNFNKIFFTVALMNVNAGYGMVKSLADSAAQPAITHMLTAMDTPQGWAQFEVSMANERVGKQEIEKLTQALLKSRNIPWFVTKTLQGHQRWVYSASFSPDGRRIVTASHDRTAKIWDTATGQLIRTLQGHRNVVCAASFSPDGQRVVTASRDGTAKIWDVATGQLIHTLQGHQGGVYSASFSPDGRWVVTASDDHTARIWDAATGQVIHTLQGHQGAIYS